MEPVITLFDFVNSVKTEIDDIKSLPICHTTTQEVLSNYIAKDKRLKSTKPIKGNKSRKKGLCFFYGKSPYAESKDMKDTQRKHPPVTLVFKKEQVPYEYTRMYPFDSGAYCAKRYNPNITTLENFLFNNPNEEILKKFIKIFFGSNKAYINRKSKCNSKPKDYPFCEALKDFILLLNSFKAKDDDLKYGEQAITVEIQIENCSLELNPEFVFAGKSTLSSEIALNQWKVLFPKSKIEPFEDSGAQGDAYTRMRDKVKEVILKNYCQ